ncbi:hypothetical protein Nos7524_5646 (plasmid) [Nostoc sp. PCC 7524]|uniref:hypothetical protein n=1 Tax=Nostoc sp. (strain ATCC 29411 / PCC 7524) TaxID=28072 RepID=UPI00029EC7BE|nr:hypothetical protein [Nostoc sp. PCC 7524]AFY51336.1 hypothetical protein Nos7524_5646 [Nostoc sp. PCC 7524]
MQTERIIVIIPEALRQGFLKPSRELNICFTDSLNQANFLLWILQEGGSNGLSTSQMVHRSGLNDNTCKCYLREFVKVGLVKKEKEHHSEAVWFYKEKSR